MRIVLIVLIIALITRNALYLGMYSEMLRALALILCAITGFIGVLQLHLVNVLKRYWPVWGYTFILLCSAVFSRDMIFVLFQSISTIAVLLFAIVFYERNRNQLMVANGALFKWTFGLYFIVCIVSIVLAVVAPRYAYETLYGGEIRFKGLFPKPGLMGASAGVLVAVVWLKSIRALKYLVLILGLICIVLTQSRTFWVASILSLLVTGVLYKPKYRVTMIVGCVVIVCMFYVGSVFKVTVDTTKIESMARINSITSLSGRLGLWQRGISATFQKPFLGHGLTAGSLALEKRNFVSSSNNDLDKSRSVGKRTLHSGYIQSLLDTGITGAFFYLMIIFRTVFCMYKYDIKREYPVEFYCIVFLIVANISENIIYAASVFNSIIFWLLACFAMSLRQAEENDKSKKYGH